MNASLLFRAMTATGLALLLPSFCNAETLAREPLLFGGCGGVYLLAEPGELVVEVVKRDRNRRATDTELQALLVGPDRQVLQEAVIPDDGEPRGGGLGPAKWATLRTRVERKGVYALNVTVSRDRYGADMVWGFRTNCSKYLIETARGHRDERHQEPLVLASPDRAAEVCFRPRAGAFHLEVTGLPPQAKELVLRRGEGQEVQRLVVQKGAATGAVGPAADRGPLPWRLALPAAQATINLGGLTRWERGDLAENLCYWSPDPKSWFPFLEHRWLLTPYSRTVYGNAGESGEVTFRVHNNAQVDQTIRLTLDFPAAPWSVVLFNSEVEVTPGATVPVVLRYQVPPGDEDHVCHLRVSPSDAHEFTTYSTLRVRPGVAPAAKPLALPLMFKPYQHENELYGYLPNYPLEAQPYFDLNHQPFMVTPAGLTTYRDGQWATNDLLDEVRSQAPGFNGAKFKPATTKVAFDRDNDVYLVASAVGKAAYLHSTDGGQTFTAYEIPGPRGGFDIEQFSGHNVPAGPPPFVRFVRTGGRDPKFRWRSENTLELFVPTKSGGQIDLGAPVLLSKVCIGLSAHSGIPSSVVSRGSKVHVAWGEATDPALSRDAVPGVPTYVATYDRATKQLGKPALIGYGPPPNDVHNSPSLTIDGDGYLHVLVGTHGRPFQYARSLKPNDAGGGWTKPVLAGQGLNQTYIGFVCGADNALHTVFRLWRSGEPYPHSTHATLAYQRKRPGQPWEPPKILCVAPFSEYSIFYHRLTIDQRGRLFLSKDYWSTHWFYRNDHFGDRRALLFSPDGGDTWKLAGAPDLLAP